MLFAQPDFHVCTGYAKEDYAIDRVFAEDATSFFVQARTGTYPDYKVLFNRYDRQTCALELSKLLTVPGEEGRSNCSRGINPCKAGCASSPATTTRRRIRIRCSLRASIRDGNPMSTPVEIDVIRDVTNNKQGSMMWPSPVTVAV
ncbi:MAG: hypothetical protein IPO05_16785 [Flavobacteriales bacterium]|nr:hypothetical protein [Flavobacteriales bacterium]